WCESRHALSAAPIFTWLMANCPIQNCRSYQVIKLLATWKKSVRKIRNSRLEIAWASLGLAGPMANALIVDRTGKIYVTKRALPVIPLMVVMRNSLSPTHDSVFICLAATMMLRLRRYFVRG